MKRTPPGPCSRPSETLPPTMPGMGRALGTTTWQSYNFTVTPEKQKSHMPLVGFKVATDHNHNLSGVAIYSWYMLVQQKSIKVGSVVFLVKFFDLLQQAQLRGSAIVTSLPYSGNRQQLDMAVCQNPGTPGEHQNSWLMDVHPTKNVSIGIDPYPHQNAFPFLPTMGFASSRGARQRLGPTENLDIAPLQSLRLEQKPQNW